MGRWCDRASSASSSATRPPDPRAPGTGGEEDHRWVEKERWWGRRRTDGEEDHRQGRMRTEEYRRVRRTGNDEEAVRETGVRLARVNPGCGAGVAGWGF